MVDSPKVPIAETLWAELSEGTGVVSPLAMTNEWLESVRTRVESGDLPEFITSDYIEGWRRYARSEVFDLFIKHRRKVGGHRIRGFIPLLNRMQAESPMWIEAQTNIDEAQTHALTRMGQHIESAILLQGAVPVALGTMTWDEIADLATQHVQQGVERGRALDEREEEAS